MHSEQRLTTQMGQWIAASPCSRSPECESLGRHLVMLSPEANYLTSFFAQKRVAIFASKVFIKGLQHVKQYKRIIIIIIYHQILIHVFCQYIEYLRIDIQNVFDDGNGTLSSFTISYLDI